MALAQTHMAVDELCRVFAGLPKPDVVKITTTGDQVVDRPLADVGGKGLFAKEIEIALMQGEIDLAVHSLKDLETFMPAELTIAAVLHRGDPHDALFTDKATDIDALPQGARIGTSSVRRGAQLRARRPDIELVPIRGNVVTRIAKLEAGAADALVLGAAGLARIEAADHRCHRLSAEEMLPAAGQGVIAIQCLSGNTELRQMLGALDHGETRVTTTAERALLAELDGSCRTPIGAFAEVEGDEVHLRALVATHDGSAIFRTERRGPVADAAAMGKDAGEELRRRAPDHVFAEA